MIRPFAPTREGFTVAQAVVAQYGDDPARCWEELALRGLVPEFMAAGDPDCAFLRRLSCVCHGTRVAGRDPVVSRPVFLPPCPRCARSHPRPSPYPVTADDALVFAATGSTWREAMQLARLFVRRLQVFAEDFAATTPPSPMVRFVRRHTADLATTRVHWRVVDRRKWSPRLYLCPIARTEQARSRATAFALALAIHPRPPPWSLWRRARRIYYATVARRLVANLRRRAVPALPEPGSEEWREAQEFQRDLARAQRTRPVAARNAARTLRTGRPPYGVTFTAASYFEAVAACARATSSFRPGRNPFEPLHALHQMGFAVDDVTARAILLVAAA